MSDEFHCVVCGTAFYFHGVTKPLCDEHYYIDLADFLGEQS